jgi:hypothetical protein
MTEPCPKKAEEAIAQRLEDEEIKEFYQRILRICILRIAL